MIDQAATIAQALQAAGTKLLSLAGGRRLDVSVQARLGRGSDTVNDCIIPFAVEAADGSAPPPGPGSKPTISVVTTDDPADYAALVVAANDAHDTAQRLWGLSGLGKAEYEARRAKAVAPVVAAAQAALRKGKAP